MKFVNMLKIYWIKITTWLGTLLSMLVYNFHKKVEGVKTKKNIKYKEHANFLQKFDVHYTLDEKTKPIIIYFHGGGWTSYTKHIFTTLTRRLASMGYVVFNCNYNLAPKYKIEDILSDSLFAIKKARHIAKEFNGDPDKIILAGDSAGAHISSLIMLKSMQDGRFKVLRNSIKALILLYGVFDLESALSSGFPGIKTYIDAAVSGGIQNKIEMQKNSPMLHNLSGFPPCLLASGEIDKLHKSQSKVFYEKLKESNVNAQKIFFDKNEFKALHSYMIVDGISTNIKTLSKIKNFLMEVCE